MGERPDPVTGRTDSTDAIRRDIDRTQREMSHTIDEIQYRLSPDHLKEEAKNRVRRAGMNARDSVRRAGVRTSRTTIDRVKANPLGAAMVGVGLWLLLRNDSNDTVYELDYDRNYRTDFDRSGMSRATYGYDNEYREFSYGEEQGTEGHGRMADVRDRVSEAADSARDRVSDVADSARDRVSEVADAARDAASYFGHRAQRLGNRGMYRARSAGMHSRDVITENPLIGGIAALALGAIIGAMIPETEREHELFGETRDRLASQATHLAGQAVDQAKDIAGSVVGAATSAATETAKREVKNAKSDIAQNIGGADEMRNV
jgi:vacuolar-type H+-ATPase subunit H